MRTISLLVALLMTSPVFADDPKPAPPAAAPASCASAEHRQFDFWIGEWEVFGKADKVVGHSRIELILNDCVIAENWSSGPGGSNDGKSFNIYNSQTGHWEQFWVDAQGNRLFLSGNFADGQMVLSGQQDKPDEKTGIAQRERISWTPNADGSVRQLWESSKDEGKTWTVAFDGLYRHPVKD
jgi:hypothetical protein